MEAYQKPFRYPADNSRSVDYKIPMGQLGLISQRLGTAAAVVDSYIPCDLTDPQHISVQALDGSTRAVLGVATGGQPEFNDNYLFSIASVAADTSIDWASATVYKVGHVVNNASNLQFICLEDHTATSATAATTAWRRDKDDSGYWQQLTPKGGFIKMTAKTNATQYARLSYLITGFSY